MSKFTEGEWVVSIHGVDKGFRAVAVILPDGGFDIAGIPNAENNAYLIAAAPDMYKCIKAAAQLFMELDGLVHDNIELDAVAANLNGLLAKARGEL